jgi:hypothetical protein
MNKFKMLVVAALAAATVATGALAAAPSASAMPQQYPLPPNCVWMDYGKYSFVICFPK